MGCMGVITSFDYPLATICQYLSMGLVCGNCVMWKPSPYCMMTSIAFTNLVMEVFKKCNVPMSCFTVCCGDGPTIGNCLSNDPRLPLMCFTGSSKVGKMV